MNDRLTNEEVEHVAKLARIYISDEEKEKYSYELKTLIDDVDKIKSVKNYDEEYLIAPVDHESFLRDDESGDMLTLNDVKNNIPHIKGNFVEVPVMINE